MLQDTYQMQDGCHDLPQSFSMGEGKPHDFQRVHHGTVVVSVMHRRTLQHNNQNNITLKTKNICSNEYTVSKNSKVKKKICCTLFIQIIIMKVTLLLNFSEVCISKHLQKSINFFMSADLV